MGRISLASVAVVASLLAASPAGAGGDSGTRSPDSSPPHPLPLTSACADAVEDGFSDVAGTHETAVDCIY